MTLWGVLHRPGFVHGPRMSDSYEKEIDISAAK